MLLTPPQYFFEVANTRGAGLTFTLCLGFCLVVTECILFTFDNHDQGIWDSIVDV